MVNFTTYNETIIPVADSYPFQDFVPTLSQFFIILITSYLVAKFQVLSASDLRGAGAFLTYIGIPAIFCVTFADIDLTGLRWELIVGLFLGKCVIFLLVAGVSLAISGNIGIAGLLAIFCVHCNDFPVGKPLLDGLYRNQNLDMGHYFFFMPPMALLVFIPIGTFMINVHKSQRLRSTENGSSDQSSLKWTQAITKREIQSLFRSMLNFIPLMIAISLGVIFNITFERKLPAALHQPIKVVAVTVPGMVQCTVGFCMVRKERFIMSSSAVTAIVLVAVKLLLTPIINYTITSLLTSGSQSPKVVTDFALLYGIVPPAAVIFLVGQEFRRPLAVMSSTLILSTFLSYPMSFAIARFTLVRTCELNHYVPLLQDILYWTACFSLFCDVIAILSFIGNRRWTQVRYRYMVCLLITQIFTSSGIVLWKVINENNHLWSVYLQMFLYFGGEISGFVWLGTIALLLISNERYTSHLQRAFSTICFTNFTICAAITALMCFLTSDDEGKTVYIVGRPRSNFEFLQLATSTAFLAVCVSIVGACLFQHFRKKYETSFVAKTNKKCDSVSPIFYIDSEDVTGMHLNGKGADSVSPVGSQKEKADLYYEEVLQNVKYEQDYFQDWYSRLCSPLLFQFTIASVKLLSNIYKLLHSLALEIMIPLEFLQSILFIGQGFFLLATFGIDVRTLSIKLAKSLRKIRYGKETFVARPSDSDQNCDCLQFCDKFTEFYILKCFQKIAKDRKWNQNVYSNCFWGHQLVDWLIEEHIAEDDVEAVSLGQKLLLGGVINHVTYTRHFHDAPFLYFFAKRRSRSQKVPCTGAELQENISNILTTKC